MAHKTDTSSHCYSRKHLVLCVFGGSWEKSPVPGWRVERAQKELPWQQRTHTSKIPWCDQMMVEKKAEVHMDVLLGKVEQLVGN